MIPYIIRCRNLFGWICTRIPLAFIALLRVGYGSALHAIELLHVPERWTTADPAHHILLLDGGASILITRIDEYVLFLLVRAGEDGVALVHHLASSVI